MKIPTRWTWNRQKEQAAQLLTEGRMTAIEIARHVGVSRETVRYWKRSPEFQARMQQHLDQFCETVSKEIERRARRSFL